MLLCKRYINNKMAAMRYYGEVILYLEQYSRRLNLFYYLKPLKFLESMCKMPSLLMIYV